MTCFRRRQRTIATSCSRRRRARPIMSSAANSMRSTFSGSINVHRRPGTRRRRARRKTRSRIRSRSTSGWFRRRFRSAPERRSSSFRSIPTRACPCWPISTSKLYYAPANPTGKLATFYPFKLPFKFIRVPNAEGHTSLVPPMVTVEAEGYPPTQFRLAAPVPEMKVEMRPAPSALRRGKNVVTIQAHDAATGSRWKHG